jgi:pimeloyl-ACP methyl ester carboxylesterase
VRGKELSSAWEEFAGRDVASDTIWKLAAQGAPPLSEGIEECWMDFDGARMRYLRAGSGPALILLHGLLGYSFSWRYAMPVVAPYRTVYAIDSLGAGFSDRPKIDHSMRATALRVLQFAENLGISSFDLLGTSRGGAVAMCAAAECLDRGHPRVRSLILVAPVNPYSSQGRWVAAFSGSRYGRPIVRAIMEHFPFLYPFMHARMFGDSKKIPAGSLDGYKAPIAIPGLFDHGLSIVTTWGADLRELDALLPKLGKIPTALMWGTKDPAVYFSSMEPLARFFPNAEKFVFPEIGHLPYEECPEDFNQALVKFLLGTRN